VSGAADRANSFIAVCIEGEALEDRGQIGSVTDHQVVDIGSTLGRSGRGRTLAFK
jgi:hypothetical protein